MAVKIRLRRMGKRDKPVYRIVVADESTKRDGTVIDTLGFYDPKAKDMVRVDRAQYAAWQKKGAQPTDAVRKLMEPSPL